MHCENYHYTDTYYCKNCSYENGEKVQVRMPGGIGVGLVVT